MIGFAIVHVQPADREGDIGLELSNSHRMLTRRSIGEIDLHAKMPVVIHVEQSRPEARRQGREQADAEMPAGSSTDRPDLSGSFFDLLHRMARPSQKPLPRQSETDSAR